MAGSRAPFAGDRLMDAAAFEPAATGWPAAAARMEATLDDARGGKIVVMAGDEEWDHEGALVLPADRVTPEAIAFMAVHGRGIVCLALPRARVEALALPLLPRRNPARHRSLFTVSIEAREGVSTGISAADRARTIAVAIDPSKGQDDLVCPGHVFPIVAGDGGVLDYVGYAEAPLDVARLCGSVAAAVMCKIVADDGSMARGGDLAAFAAHHRLTFVTVNDLAAYRARRDPLVRRLSASAVTLGDLGPCRATVYRNAVTGATYTTVLKDGDAREPVVVFVRGIDPLVQSLGLVHGVGPSPLDAVRRALDGPDRGIAVLVHRWVEGGPEPCAATLAETFDIAQIVIDLGLETVPLKVDGPVAVEGLTRLCLTATGCIEKSNEPQFKKTNCADNRPL